MRQWLFNLYHIACRWGSDCLIFTTLPAGEAVSIAWHVYLCFSASVAQCMMAAFHPPCPTCASCTSFTWSADSSSTSTTGCRSAVSLLTLFLSASQLAVLTPLLPVSEGFLDAVCAKHAVWWIAGLAMLIILTKGISVAPFYRTSAQSTWKKH